MKSKLILGFLALVAACHATTVLNESDSGTPTFPADYTVSFSGMATFPCNQTPLSGNNTPCNLPASWTANGVTVSGTGLQLMNNASLNAGAAAPMGANDWLIYVASGQSITFTFSSPVQAAGLILDTDHPGNSGGTVIINGLSYAHPGGANFPYWIGFTDDTQSTVSMTLTAGPNSGFLMDSLNVKNADPIAPTAEATPMALVGSGLTFLGFLKRRRGGQA